MEKEFAEFLGVSSAIGVANGTDALEIALRALEIGVGDEVITVSHTAVATVAAIEAVGATPVLVDVDPVFYTLNPKQLEEVISSKTKAVIAVHLYGQSADLDLIGSFCSKNKLFLIEDVSQAHGARWREKRLGSFGHISCFSCYPTKNLGALGDAGLIATNDLDLGRKVRMIREYGWQQRYISDIPGRNSRMDEVQAAILRIKLRYLDSDNEKRQQIAACYSAGLVDVNLNLPLTHQFAEHVFHLYVVATSDRDALLAFLKTRGIYAGIHYPVSIHLQAAYLGRIKTALNMNISEDLQNKVLSLPIYPELKVEDIEYILCAITDFKGL